MFKIRIKSLFLILIISCFCRHGLYSVDYAWTNTTSDSWETSGNWNPNGDPNLATDSTTLDTATIGTGNLTITLGDGDRSIGAINLANDGSGDYYILAGTGDPTLTIDGVVGGATGGQFTTASSLSISLDPNASFSSTVFENVINIEGPLSSINGLPIGTFTDLTLSGTTSISGGVTIGTASTCTFTGSSSFPSGPITNNGVLVVDIAGTLSSNISGSGTVTYSADSITIENGSNTYTGATTVAVTGVVVADSETALPSSSAITVDGQLTINQNNAIGSLAGTGSISIASGKLLFTNQDNSSTGYSGTISGAGSFEKLGLGTLTLSGENTTTGTNSITAGALTVSNGALSQDSIVYVGAAGVLNIGGNESVGSFNGAAGSTVVIDDTFALTEGSLDISSNFFGNISGLGGLTKEGTEVLSLDGENTYFGPTTINDGTVDATSLTALSPNSDFSLAAGASMLVRENNSISSLSGDAGASITLIEDAVLTIGGSVSDTVYSGDITNIGGIIKVGANSQTLSGSSGYSGLTQIFEGTLAITTQSAFPSASSFSIGSNGILDFSANGVIVGPNALSGSGTLNMGSNTILVGLDNLDASFTGTITGSGDFVQSGLGEYTIGGDCNISGILGVQAGTLTVNGNAPNAAMVLVLEDGTLKGTGTLSQVTNQGTVAPGNSIGTLTITGDYIQATGSTLEIEFNNASQRDLLDISGDAEIQAGSTLTLLPEAGIYTGGLEYTFLNAGSLTGTFDTVNVGNSNLGSLTTSLTYNADSIILTLLGSNPISAGALHSYMLSETRNLTQSISDIQLSNVAQRMNQFLLHSRPCSYKKNCNVYKSKNVVVDENGKKVKTTITTTGSKLNDSYKEDSKIDQFEPTITPFIQFGYLSGDIRPTDNNSANRFKVYAPFIGLEFNPTNKVLLGFGFNYDNSLTQDLLKRGSISADTYGFSGYLECVAWKYLAFGLGSTTGWTEYNISHVSITNDIAKATPNGWFVNTELSLNSMICIHRFLLMPIAKAKYNHMQVNPYTEKNTLERLNVNYDGVNSISGEFGVSFAPEFFPGCSVLIPQFTFSQNIPFNSSKRQVFVQNFAETASTYSTIDNTNLYYTRVAAGLSCYLKGIFNIYANGSYLINSGMKNTFEVVGGAGYSF